MKQVNKRKYLEFLKEDGIYSQGRIYLFVSIIVYYITLLILTLTGLGKKHATIDMTNFETIIEALKYSMTLFAGYVFGGKFLNVVSLLKGGKNTDS